ncbi:MAG: hypothetical protein GEV12_00050 [Micromonosporaceae bacterium]|nr:hypothetical protein [Micromonosporaceae bacterium]
MVPGTARYTDVDTWYAEAVANGWTDGLPVNPPTTAAVAAGVRALARDGAEVLGVVPPRRGLATVEQVVVNSVMAGCPPEALPVVVAALDAVLDPVFELAAVQLTTNACAPLVVVSGPAVAELGFNPAEGAFAGGSRATATVGRALRLILRNIGGSVPGDTCKVTHGHPGWFSFCVAERADASPWPPFHTARGFPESASCATVFACQAPFPLYVPGSPNRVLRVLGTSMATPGVNMFFGGGQVLLVFAPRVARSLAAAGLNRAAVAARVWQEAHYSLGALRAGQIFETEGHTFYWGARHPAPDLTALDDDATLPMVDSPGDIHILVSGGDGQFWVGFCPGWGEFGGLAVTREIEAVS